MDMLKTVREIGFFETGCNLVEVIASEDVQAKAGVVMPLPKQVLVNSISDIADWLAAFGKEKYMFLSPEISIVDKLAEKSPNHEAILLIPCDMDLEVKERLKANIPKSMKVSLLEEPYFPEAFYPENGILVICGYLACGRMMVLPETYRMIDHYSGFWGKKVFVPYVELDEAVRYDGWMEVGKDKISMIWRNE